MKEENLTIEMYDRKIQLNGICKHSCFECPYFRHTNKGSEVFMNPQSVLATSIEGECLFNPPVPIAATYSTSDYRKKHNTHDTRVVSSRPKVTASDFCNVLVSIKNTRELNSSRGPM